MELIFEWNENKAKQNFRKHKVSFEEAKTVFNDPRSITFPDEHHSYQEERYLSIGLSVSNKVLLVVHIEREEKKNIVVIRIISCRRATTTERRTYE